jgi:hypothetical protein
MNQQEQTSLIYSSFLNNFSKPDYTFEAQAEEESMDNFSESLIHYNNNRDETCMKTDHYDSTGLQNAFLFDDFDDWFSNI